MYTSKKKRVSPAVLTLLSPQNLNLQKKSHHVSPPQQFAIQIRRLLTHLSFEALGPRKRPRCFESERRKVGVAVEPQEPQHRNPSPELPVHRPCLGENADSPTLRFVAFFLIDPHEKKGERQMAKNGTMAGVEKRTPA